MSDQQQDVVLELKDVCLSFKSKKTTFEHGVHNILDSVSLQLLRGETLGVIGKNGCGKSTILRLMAGILSPSSGIVERESGLSVALLTLGLGFKRNLSGRDNALLAAVLQGSSRREAETFLEQIKEFSELGDSFEEPVKTYSSGMRSRLGFSTALKTHVDVLLIDEILSVGDAHFKKKAQRALRERIDGEQTVVFVSHADAQIRSLCERAIWLQEGKVAAQGKSSDVVHEYRRYVKSMDKN